MQRLCGLSLDIYEDVVDGFARVAHARAILILSSPRPHRCSWAGAHRSILAQRGRATQVWLLDRS